MLVSQINLVSQTPNQKIINQAKKVIVEKDVVILQEAKQVKTNYLVTLDQKHFLNEAVEKFLKPQKVLTPKTLIQNLEKSSNSA